MRKKKFNRKPFPIVIYGEEWTVKYKNPVHANGHLACGECCYSSKTIYIDSKLDYSMTIVTLLHELFHAYTRRSGIYNGNLSEDMEEIIADQFATVLVENFDFEI